MLTNEVLEDIYQFREAHAKLFNYDVTAMFADWRKRQLESGRESITFLHPNKPDKSLAPSGK